MPSGIPYLDGELASWSSLYWLASMKRFCCGVEYMYTVGTLTNKNCTWSHAVGAAMCTPPAGRSRTTAANHRSPNIRAADRSGNAHDGASDARTPDLCPRLSSVGARRAEVSQHGRIPSPSSPLCPPLFPSFWTRLLRVSSTARRPFAARNKDQAPCGSSAKAVS